MTVATVEVKVAVKVKRDVTVEVKVTCKRSVKGKGEGVARG